MKNIILFLFIAIMFVGCTTKEEIVVIKVKELPSWFITMPKDTSTILYARGEGKNKDEAVKNALVPILAKLDSKVIKNINLINNYQLTSNEIYKSVLKIKIDNYKIIEYQDFSVNRYLVLVELDMSKYFNNLKKELNQKFTSINQKGDCQPKNIIECFKIYKEAKEILIGAKNTLIMMNSLQNNFDISKYLEGYERINSDYEKLQSSITFSIQTDENSKALESVILNGLSVEKLQILDKKENLSTHLTIIIKSKITKTFVNKFFSVDEDISIIVKDFKESIVCSNELNITGQSIENYDLAQEKVIQKLNLLVYKNGIEKIIGLSL